MLCSVSLISNNPLLLSCGIIYVSTPLTQKINVNQNKKKNCHKRVNYSKQAQNTNQHASSSLTTKHAAYSRFGSFDLYSSNPLLFSCLYHTCQCHSSKINQKHSAMKVNYSKQAQNINQTRLILSYNNLLSTRFL